MSVRLNSVFQKSGSDLDFVSDFRELAEIVSAKLAAYGVETKPYHDPSLPLYRALTPELQRARLEDLKTYLQTIEMCERSGDRFDETRAVWHALSRLGAMPSSDLLDKIPPNCAVEIYDSNGIQLWRNSVMMRACSYTLEEILSIEWHLRYDRDPEISAHCFRAISEVMSGQYGESFEPEMPEHTALETCSMERYLVTCKLSLIARLKDRYGNDFGFLCAWSILSARKTKEIDLASLQEQPALQIV